MTKEIELKKCGKANCQPEMTRGCGCGDMFIVECGCGVFNQQPADNEESAAQIWQMHLDMEVLGEKNNDN